LQGHWFFGEFRTIGAEEEPGQTHLRWLREYRNPTGLVSYPVLFYTRRVMPTSSLAIQHILNNGSIYVKPELERRTLQNILGHGLLTAEGDMHARQRKVLNPAFATGYIRDIVHIFSQKADDLVCIVLEQLKLQPAEGIEIFQFLRRSALDVIGSAGSLYLVHADIGFGYEFNSLHNPDDPFAKAYATVAHQTDGTVALNVAAVYIPFLLRLPFPRVLEMSAARKTITRQATKLVREKEAESTTGNDILSLMIAENHKSEGQLAEMELVDQCMTFLAAGHETTSSAVILIPTVFDNSWHGDYISLRNIQMYKIVYALQFNIYTILHWNKLTPVVI
jgi:cytochrome P450